VGAFASFTHLGRLGTTAMTPYQEAKFDPYSGALLFEFQRPGMSTDEFCLRLDQFFLMLPRGFDYAVEIRNPDLLGVHFSLMLSRHGVAHVYNHWTGMPPLAEQHTHMLGFTAVFTVLRLLTPLRMSYAAAKKRRGVVRPMHVQTMSP
jgi:hypothetical protein